MLKIKYFISAHFFELWYKILCCGAQQCKPQRLGIRSRSSCGHLTLPWRSEDRCSPGTGHWNGQALMGSGTRFVTYLHLGWFSLSPLGITELPFLLLLFFLIILFLSKLRSKYNISKIKSWGEVRMGGSFQPLSVQMWNNYSQAEF